MSTERAFKGIWIPAEIWLHPELSPNERFLWAEINSLDDRDKGGCWASNKYLADFLQLDDETHISKMISHLVELGLVQRVSFDGRIRVIKAISPMENPSQGWEKTQGGLGKKPKAGFGKNPSNNSSSKNIYINKEEEEGDPSPDFSNLNYEEGKEEAIGRAVNVATTPSQHFEVVKKLGSEERAVRAYGKLSEWKIGKGIGQGFNDFKALMGWVAAALAEEDAKSGATGKLKRQAFIDQVKELYPEVPGQFIHGHNYFEFVKGPAVPSDIIYFHDHGFVEQVLNGLRKMGIYRGDIDLTAA